MVKRGRLQHWAFVLRILCAVALVSVGLAHKIPVFASSSKGYFDLSSYELPDGTFPVFCLTDNGDRTSKQPQSRRSDCDACRISCSVILPVPESGTVNRPLRAMCGPSGRAMPPVMSSGCHRTAVRARHLSSFPSPETVSGPLIGPDCLPGHCGASRLQRPGYRWMY